MALTLSQEEGRQLRRRRPAGLTKRPCRIKSDLIRQKLAAALLEFPPPSLSEVIRRVAVHPTKIRSDFPDLWRALRARYVQFKQDALSRKGQAFADDIRRAVAELHDKGINPTSQLVLPTLPKPLYRSWDIVANAVRLARRELLIEPSAPHRQPR